MTVDPTLEATPPHPSPTPVQTALWIGLGLVVVFMLALVVDTLVNKPAVVPPPLQPAALVKTTIPPVTDLACTLATTEGGIDPATTPAPAAVLTLELQWTNTPSIQGVVVFPVTKRTPFAKLTWANMVPGYGDATTHFVFTTPPTPGPHIYVVSTTALSGPKISTPVSVTCTWP